MLDKHSCRQWIVWIHWDPFVSFKQVNSNILSFVFTTQHSFLWKSEPFQRYCRFCRHQHFLYAFHRLWRDFKYEHLVKWRTPKWNTWMINNRQQIFIRSHAYELPVKWHRMQFITNPIPNLDLVLIDTTNPITANRNSLNFLPFILPLKPFSEMLFALDVNLLTWSIRNCIRAERKILCDYFRRDSHSCNFGAVMQLQFNCRFNIIAIKPFNNASDIVVKQKSRIVSWAAVVGCAQRTLQVWS